MDALLLSWIFSLLNESSEKSCWSSYSITCIFVSCLICDPYIRLCFTIWNTREMHESSKGIGSALQNSGVMVVVWGGSYESMPGISKLCDIRQC